VCTSRGIVIYAADSGAEVQRSSFRADCTYRVALPPGTYRVELDRHGLDRNQALPHSVTVLSGQTTHLDIGIDTGIR